MHINILHLLVVDPKASFTTKPLRSSSNASWRHLTKAMCTSGTLALGHLNTGGPGARETIRLACDCEVIFSLIHKVAQFFKA